jgi:hypothetical protein
MPSRFRLFSGWHLIYSSSQNGFSLSTLYHCSFEKFATSSPQLPVRSAIAISSLSTSMPQPTRPHSMMGSSSQQQQQRPQKRFLGPCLLILKDTENTLFGAYMSEHCRPAISHYGSSDWFADLSLIFLLFNNFYAVFFGG